VVMSDGKCKRILSPTALLWMPWNRYEDPRGKIQRWVRAIFGFCPFLFPPKERIINFNKAVPDSPKCKMQDVCVRICGSFFGGTYPQHVIFHMQADKCPHFKRNPHAVGLVQNTCIPHCGLSWLV
jgi:hypothetical protein